MRLAYAVLLALAGCPGPAAQPATPTLPGTGAIPGDRRSTMAAAAVR
jgi:hypothetical protein